MADTRLPQSVERLTRNRIDIAGKGGNCLLNIGPKGDGSVPPESIKSMQAIGAWMKVNGAALCGTTASPFASLDWGRCTCGLATIGRRTERQRKRKGSTVVLTPEIIVGNIDRYF